MALIPNGSKMPSTNKQPEVKKTEAIKPLPATPVKTVQETVKSVAPVQVDLKKKYKS